MNQIEEVKNFDILVYNFGNHPFQLLLNRTIARSDDHPTNLAESHISHGELLGINEENKHNKKRDINVKDIETINKNLADARKEEHGQVEERPITADVVQHPWLAETF